MLNPPAKPALSNVDGVSGTLFCRTLEIVLDILTATPLPALLGGLAWRLVPAFETFEAMLLETELMIAVALAIPCFVRLAGLGTGGREESLTGDRDGWRTLFVFRDDESFPEDSPNNC